MSKDDCFRRLTGFLFEWIFPVILEKKDRVQSGQGKPGKHGKWGLDFQKSGENQRKSEKWEKFRGKVCEFILLWPNFQSIMVDNVSAYQEIKSKLSPSIVICRIDEGKWRWNPLWTLKELSIRFFSCANQFLL